MSAQDRRRERRAAKQAEWKQANPLLVGVKAKPTCRPILTLNRKPVDRVVKAVDTDTEYYKQIQAAAERATLSLGKPKNFNTVRPGATHIVNARQKMRGKSIPLI